MSDSIPATGDDNSPPNVAINTRLISQRLGYWLTVVANLGVVLGLFIVIVEVRQNAALTRAAMEQQKNNLMADIELTMADPQLATVWMKSIRTPEALTDSELRQIESVLVATLLQWEHRFQMEQAGLVSRDEATQHIANSAPWAFGSRFGKKWWSINQEGWVGTPMIEVADPVIAGVDENFIADYYDNLRLSLAGEVPELGSPAR